MIQTSYDPTVDTLFVRFGVGGAIPVRMEEVAPGVQVDFDATGNPIGVVVLNVHARMIQDAGTVYAGATVPRKPTAAQT